MKLKEIAHSRTGDKGDISNISLIPYKKEDYEMLKEKVTPEVVWKFSTVQCDHTFKAGLEIQGPLLMIAGYKKYLFDYIISG